MNLPDTKIKEILLQGNYVTADDISKAEQFAKERRSSILDYLIQEELISTTLLGQAIAESFGIKFADLNSQPPAEAALTSIPEAQARKLRTVCWRTTTTSATLVTDAPETPGLVEALQAFLPKKKLTLAFTLSVDLDQALSRYPHSLNTRFSEIIGSGEKIAPEIVDQILEEAISLRASDIHIEPEEVDAVIRLRIDGVLHDAGKIPSEFVPTIINRIKVLARLRIDEHFSAQDGAIRFQSKVTKTSTDFRVSVLPTINGEKAAIRLLTSYIRDLNLSDIGLNTELQGILEKSLKKSFGMILVTGPTGSGKTTTLYGVLKALNTRQINITTIEDPVEYKISGINQIQTNEQARLTFASGLRAIARQDPNVILVGEIRDFETADIAVNAALTGHLLLSTFHANNAITVIPRLIDMGIEPFLISSTLELIVAQRLVRKICLSCKVSRKMTKTEFQKLPEPARLSMGNTVPTVYSGKGCATCHGTGFQGRVGVFEAIIMTPQLQELITKRPSSEQIASVLQKQSFSSMMDDGIQKVLNGQTTFEELFRVVQPA